MVTAQPYTLATGDGPFGPSLRLRKLTNRPRGAALLKSCRIVLQSKVIYLK